MKAFKPNHAHISNLLTLKTPQQRTDYLREKVALYQRDNIRQVIVRQLGWGAFA